MYTETRNYEDLEFSHFVVITSDGSIIAFARNNGSVYKFLMDIENGWIKIRSADQWLELTDEESERIRQRAQEAFGRVPVHRVPRFIL